MSAPLTVWITRTDMSAVRSAQVISEAGLIPLISPLLKLTPASYPEAAPPDDCALAFTSANGVRAFTALTDRRGWRVYCVGPATALAAKNAGFSDVVEAGGDVDELAKLIIAQAECPIVHFSGVHVAGDLVGMLSEAGLQARRTIIYATQSVTALPEIAVSALSQKKPLAVFLYSPKGARTFLHIMRLAPIHTDHPSLHIISISEAVDQVLGSAIYTSRRISALPNEVSMIDAALSLTLEIGAAKA